METMRTNEVPLVDLVERLDTFFKIFKDPAFTRFLPRAYEKVGFDFKKVFEPEFCGLFNGLMLKGSDKVQEVFCIAFPTPDVLRTILDTMTSDTLIFTHHPIDMMVSGTGFLPIEVDLLRQLQEREISIYSIHAPMDVHNELGTNAAIVQALGITVSESFAKYGKGFAGRIGVTEQVTFQTFLQRVGDIFGVVPKIGGGEIETVNKIAIVAGGGDEVDLMEEAQQKECDVYLTGEWFTRGRPTDKDGREWAIGNDKACKAFAKRTGMSLVAVSHAASEFLVMKHQMIQWFEKLGLKATAIQQKDWWR